jgi:polysaccharide export outer membrane protein
MNLLKLSAKNLFLFALFLSFFLLAGCQTPPPTTTANEQFTTPEGSVVLREGDQVKITFPGNPRLDAAQAIRRDGKVVLPVFGEIQAAGTTPAELEKQILEKFGKELVSKEVTVTLENSQISIFVNGAVLRPGKIDSPRPITALEAIMEAGGFNYSTANLKAVKIIRTEGSDVKTYILDFRGVLAGKPTKPFYVRSSDIIYVPERFTVF